MRPRIGDIFEITTPAGRAYFQYIYQHPQFGGLIRILPGIYREAAPDVAILAAGEERFVTFFPLRAAARAGIVTRVGTADIPGPSQTFPLFRAGLPDPSTGKITDWWLWDGAREWHVGTLPAEHQNLPIREIVTDVVLVSRILKDWADV